MSEFRFLSTRKQCNQKAFHYYDFWLNNIFNFNFYWRNWKWKLFVQKIFAISFFQILALCVSDRMILLLSIEKIFHFEISKGFLKLDLFLDLRAMCTVSLFLLDILLFHDKLMPRFGLLWEPPQMDFCPWKWEEDKKILPAAIL